MDKRDRGKQRNQHELEWVGGRFPAPILVGEEEPVRPDMILWLELPSDLIVAHEIVEPKDRARTLASTFERALSAPLAGPPRRPARVRVEDVHLAAELRASVGDDIDLVVAPTPELGAAVQLMVEHLSRVRGGPAPSYFKGGRVSEPAVAELFAAAALLHPVVPWKRVNHIAPMRIDIPALGIAGGCVVAIGAQDESVAILLFPSRLAFDAFSEAAAHNTTVGRIDSIDTSVVALHFERASDLPGSLRKEAATHRWPVASADAYPVVDRRSADGMSQPVTEHDVLVMTALATSLTGFYARHGTQLAQASRLPISETVDTAGSASVRITIPYESFADFELESMRPAARAEHASPPSTVRKVGRNDKCPCGSGKKYKHCHLLTERAASNPVDPAKSQRERDEILVRELMRYAARRFPESLTEWREQFDDIEAIDQFRGPLSLYHVPFEGRTIVDWFLEDRGSKLAPEDLEILHAQRRSWMSAWEARDVEPGVGMTLVDLLTGETRRVAERSGSRGLVERDGVLARIVEIGGVQLVCGMYPRVLSPEGVAEVVASMKKWLKRMRKNVPVREALLEHEVTLRMCLLWQDAVAEADLASLVPPRLTNTDGEPLLMTEDFYVFERADGEEIARRLAAMEGVVAPEPDEPDSGYDVLRPGNKMHAHWDNTVVGRVFVSGGELRIETNSVARGNALRERIEAALIGLVRHRARAHEDPVSDGMMARLHGRAQGPRTLERERTVPPELLVALQREKIEAYRAWLDQPIPALGGKTPRQAARNKSSRAKLDVLLKTIENREARGPVAERFDVRVLREELGLVDPR